MLNRLMIFCFIIFVLSSSPVRSDDPSSSDKPTVGDLGDGGTVLAIDLPNSSYEQGGDTPANWTPLDGYIGANYQWSSSVASTGLRSVLIRGTRYFYGRWESDAIDVQKAGFSWYTLTGAVKTEANDGEVYLSIAWLDSNGVPITTSDSPMLHFGDTDWQRVTLEALPPDGAVRVSVWCISNHNSGTTWFDDLKLTVTQLGAKGALSYAQFLEEYPAHPLALAAHLMRVRVLMTEAKWIKEAAFGDPDKHLRASVLYQQAADIARDDEVLLLASVAAGEVFAEEQERFESLIDIALWEAVATARDSGDITQLRQSLSKIVERNRDAASKAAAEAWIKEIDAEAKLND